MKMRILCGDEKEEAKKKKKKNEPLRAIYALISTFHFPHMRNQNKRS